MTDPKHEGLPVAGYQPQNGAAVELVNRNKLAEERVLRILDELASIEAVGQALAGHRAHPDRAGLHGGQPRGLQAGPDRRPPGNAGPELMPRRKPTSPYRIVGARGEWFAWHRAGSLLRGWEPHVARITVGSGRKAYAVTAVHGRTPFEALERLKRIEARAC